MADLEDLCPDDPEDRDSFEDEDGCPDPDNDGDRVADVDDFCPDLAEPYNGIEDCDGCPDRSHHGPIMRSGGFGPITIAFAADSSALGPEQRESLDWAVAEYQCNSHEPKLHMVGYMAEALESARQLAQARGTAVRDYFLSHGLAQVSLRPLVIERAEGKNNRLELLAPAPDDKAVIARLLGGSVRERIEGAWHIHMARLPRRERSEAYFQPLVANLKHQDEGVRSETARALGALDARIIPILKRARRGEASKLVRMSIDAALLNALTRELEPGKSGSSSKANRRELVRLQKNKARREEKARREADRLKKNYARKVARQEKNKARYEERVRRERERAIEAEKERREKNKIRQRERRHSWDSSTTAPESNR